MASIEVIVAGVGTGDEDVGLEGVVEEEGVLGDQGRMGSQIIEPVVLDVVAIEGDAALVTVPEAHQEVGHGRLAGAAGADEGHRGPCRNCKVDVRDGGLDAAGIGVGRVFQGDRRAAAGACGVDARSVGDGHGLAVDRVEAPRCAQGIGELAADVGDLAHRQEGRHGREREEGKEAAVEVARGHHGGACDDDRQAAQTRRHLEDGHLDREVAEEGKARLVDRAGDGDEGVAAFADLAEGEDLAQSLDRIGGEGIELAQGLAGLGAQPVEAAAQHDRRERDDGEEGDEGDRHGPAERHQDADHDGRSQHRHEGRSHGVGIEGFDGLDVLRRHGREIAGAPAQEVGRGQAVDLVEEPDPHARQQAKRHVVGEPRFEPVQDTGERRGDGKPDQEPCPVLPVGDARHHEGRKTRPRR